MKLNSLKPILFLLLSFILISHGRLTMDPIDENAFKLFQKDLKLTNHFQSGNTCKYPGVVCEKRVSNHTSILRITHLVFDSQDLYVPIPRSIGKIQELRELTLSNNHLTGQLPVQLFSFTRLEILNLKSNDFSGKVPLELSKLFHIRILDLSYNKFSGDLNFLKHLLNLESLSLSNNLFEGKIPSSIRSLRNVKSLNKPGIKHMQGPEVSTKWETKTIVPRRYIFAETTHSSVRKNNHSSSWAPSPTSSTSKNHKKTKKILLTILAGFVGGSTAGMLLTFMVCVLAANSPNKTQNVTIFSPLIKRSEDLKFLQEEDALANMEMIGSGGCGEVYVGNLIGDNPGISTDRVDSLSEQDISTQSLAWVTRNSCGDNP